MNFFRKFALLLGYPLAGVLLLALVGLAVRYSQIQLSDPPLSQKHLENKQAYLQSIAPGSTAPPNILIIFFDDLGWGDLSSYGNQLIDTPHIDRVADEGVLMSNFYSASPVCTPSRAALLTGRFPPRTRTDTHVFFPDASMLGTMRRMVGWANELPREEITIAEVLRPAGYRTGMIGKWHLGDREGHRPNDFGFDDWYGVLFSNDMFPLDMYRNDGIVIKDERVGSFFSSERDEADPLPGQGIDQTTLTQMYTDQAIAFMAEQNERPFFLYLSHSFPHVPHYPSREHANSSRGGAYGDVVEDLDRSTGQLMAALERLGIADNTLVFITSDNGADYNGSPGMLRGRKGDVLEGGQRVPMIVRWPTHIPEGVISHEMAMNIDVFPTLLNLVGVNLPADRTIDGKDIAPMLSGQTESPHDYLYYFAATESLPAAIRDERFKLHGKSGDVGRNRSHLSLLHQDAENHEVGNLYPEAKQRLEQQLIDMQQAIEESPRGWK